MPSDPRVFDEFKLPFIFVPHGAPEPNEWLQRHPDYIKLPATMVPRPSSGGRSNRSSNPPPGEQRSMDGLAASPGPTAPRLPTGNDMPDAMSGTTRETAGRTFIGADPIAAYRRANDALATAASDYTTSCAVALDVHAHAHLASDPLGLVIQED